MRFALFCLASLAFAQITPSGQHLNAGGILQLASTPTAISWNATLGTMLPNGIYQAPTIITTATTVTITATTGSGILTATIFLDVSPAPYGVAIQQTNGTIVWLPPTGALIADYTHHVLRSTNNAGLRGIPGQIWVIDSAGDGVAATLSQTSPVQYQLSGTGTGTIITFTAPTPALSNLIQFDSTLNLNIGTSPPTLSAVVPALSSIMQVGPGLSLNTNTVPPTLNPYTPGFETYTPAFQATTITMQGSWSQSGLYVWRNGLYMTPCTNTTANCDYTLSGNILTFIVPFGGDPTTTPPQTPDIISVIHITP